MTAKRRTMKQNKQNRLAATAERRVRRHRVTAVKTSPIEPGILRVIPLGGQNGIGEKNMIVVEYENDAVVLDCGQDLGIDLPGVNYLVPAVDYLRSIKHKLRGYIISHGHLDHIGGLPHIVPDCPAPIIGSPFTTGKVQALFEKSHGQFTPEVMTLDMEQHQHVILGVFRVELVRVTHSIPDSSAIVVDTPLGRLVNTGDFRLDPEPLDAKQSDTTRLIQLGEQGVLLLMSESTNTNKPGRTPTEHSLRQSFERVIEQAPGRVFVAVFASNMNRVQMVVDAAVRSGRKVVLDGRSMLLDAELAVRQGVLKIPKDTLIPMRRAASVPSNQLVVICTGGQGEPGAALGKMAAGEHTTIKLRRSDTVIISSTPIVGNENNYQQLGDDLALIGLKQYRHPTHELDGCGPLHVSGHGSQDEHADMIRLTRPRYLMPIYGGALHREYHRQVGRRTGLPDSQIIMAENGAVIEFSSRGLHRSTHRATYGAQPIDSNGRPVTLSATMRRIVQGA